MNIEDLTPSERRLWKAFPKGEAVDLSTGDPALDDIGQSDRWGHDRVVRAEVLVALLVGAVDPEPGQVAAVRPAYARITGSLNLGHAEVTVPLALTGCAFDDAPHLYWASMTSVHLMRCRLPGLVASGTRVDGHLWLEGSRINGGLWLDGANITGILNMSGVQLTNPGGDALLADRLSVEANVYCDQGFIANGEVRLPGAHIGGQLIFRGAAALQPVRRRRPVRQPPGRGRERVLRRRIHRRRRDPPPRRQRRRLPLLRRREPVRTGTHRPQRGRPHRRDRHLLLGRLHRRRRRQFLRRPRHRPAQPARRPPAPRQRDGPQPPARPGRRAAPAHRRTDQGTADFSYARINLLRDDAASWPERLQLDGLQYETLEPPLTARERLDWLRRDTDGYAPQPYERLAQTYRTLGLDADGRSVLLAKARDRRQTQASPQDRRLAAGRPGRLRLPPVPRRQLADRPPRLRHDRLLHPPAGRPGRRPQTPLQRLLLHLDLLLPIGSLGQEIEFAPRASTSG